MVVQFPPAIYVAIYYIYQYVSTIQAPECCHSCDIYVTRCDVKFHDII